MSAPGIHMVAPPGLPGNVDVARFENAPTPASNGRLLRTRRPRRWFDLPHRRAPVVDLVFGSPAIARVGELVDRVRRDRRSVLETGEGPLVKITARPSSAGRLKAFVTVMEGCEKHCTFCVVPRTRGRERSH